MRTSLEHLADPPGGVPEPDAWPAPLPVRGDRLTLIAVALFLSLVFCVNQILGFVLPVFLGTLAIFYGPFRKRTVCRRAALALRWELPPE